MTDSWGAIEKNSRDGYVQEASSVGEIRRDNDGTAAKEKLPFPFLITFALSPTMGRAESLQASPQEECLSSIDLCAVA